MTKVDSELVKELYKELLSYSEIARFLGVSRQRIHQIIKNYRTNKKWDDPLKNCCKCGINKAKHHHHIDSNSLNNREKNIMQVCISCHYDIHWQLNMKNRLSDIISSVK